MTSVLLRPGPDAVDVDPERPRVVDPGRSPADAVFRLGVLLVALVTFAILGSIGVFLGFQSIPTLRHYGWSFFTESQWNPEKDVVGISGVVLGTFTVAIIAMFFAIPLSLSVSLYITQYAPRWARSTFTSLVDLMAAIPSIIFGLWGYFSFEPHGIHIANWLQRNLGFVPLFHTHADASAAAPQLDKYVGSAFVAGFVVAFMVLPMASAVMIGVFGQAPIGEREAALALGSTRWGVIRTVVLPFGRGGIIGGTMLALGRALGETIAVVIIISAATDLKVRPLESGTDTVSALIAGRFGDATSSQLSALLAAGFVLFMITLVVNTAASVIVNRSRSGAGTDA